MFAVVYAAGEVAEPTGLASLGIDVTSLLIYLVNFGVLLAILYFVGYKKILAMMDQRAARVKESLEEADRVREEAANQTAELQRSLEEGRQASQKVLADAREAAQRFRDEEEEKARVDAQGILDRARSEIQRERDAAIDQVRSEFAGLAVTAAERIIHRTVDVKTHQDLIDEVLAQDSSFRNAGG